MRGFKILTVCAIVVFIITLLSCGGVKKKIEEKVGEETGEHFEMGGVEHDEGGNLGVGDLPSNFPGELIYPGMSIDEITTMAMTTVVKGYSKSGYGEIADYYKSKMSGNGWKNAATSQHSDGIEFVYIKKKQQATIQLEKSDKSGFNTEIITSYSSPQ